MTAGPVGSAGTSGSTGTGPRPVEADWSRAVEAIRGADRILLVCHVQPDGDALGSMLAAGLGLRRLGRTVQASFPSPYELAPPYDELPGSDLLVPPESAYPRPDLLMTFDASSADRLGELADRVGTAREVVVADHHPSNTRFGTIHLVDAGAAATAVLVDELLRRLGVELDPAIAECLYVGLCTDTGSFRYQATTPAVHELAGRLLATGIPHHEISRRLFDSRPFGALGVLAQALDRAVLDREAAAGHGLVWSYATRADLDRYGQRRQVLESVIDIVRTADEADVACLAKEVGPGEWSVSLRSKGAVDVSRVAVALGGGGHRYAAGFTGRGEVADVVAAVRAQLG